MKGILKLSFALLLLISVIGCKKKNEEVSADSLHGSWVLKSVAGGQTAAVPGYKPNNAQVLTFYGGKFQRDENGKEVENSTYIIRPENKQFNDKTANYSIRFNADEKSFLNTQDRIYLSLSGNKMILFIGVIAADGVEMTYERQKGTPID